MLVYRCDHLGCRSEIRNPTSVDVREFGWEVWMSTGERGLATVHRCPKHALNPGIKQAYYDGKFWVDRDHNVLKGAQ